VGGVAVKYNVYLSDLIVLEFQPSDRSRVELAARLLRHVGVDAEVKSMLSLRKARAARSC